MAMLPIWCQKVPKLPAFWRLLMRFGASIENYRDKVTMGHGACSYACLKGLGRSGFEPLKA
jgi:hypothetical protein